jgi:hypothetical protein
MLRTAPAGAGLMKVLLNAFQFLFGCRHRHLSRVFTIKHRTYKVCFDCGREFDLPDTASLKGIPASAVGPPVVAASRPIDATMVR